MSDPMRLRMKVYTDPSGRKYLAASGMLDTRTGVITAVLLSDEDTRSTTFLVSEWNALPFFYFKEDGPAPRMEKKWDPEKGREIP